MLAGFTKKHANIKTDYQGSGWDTVNQVVPLGIRNGSAPDIFGVPNNVPPRPRSRRAGCSRSIR